ncbi:hypothetical protein MMC07_003756 [Pseudocyphellaria aurata]|nr:hypothetical protein [Pseudocyphellaria aurata]
MFGKSAHEEGCNMSGSNVSKAQKSNSKQRTAKKVDDEALIQRSPNGLDSVALDPAQQNASTSASPPSDPNILVTPQGSFRMGKEKRPTISPLSKLIRKQHAAKYHTSRLPTETETEAEGILGYVPPGISKSEFLDCHSTFLNLDNDDDGDETAAEVSSMGCPPVSSVSGPPSPNRPFVSPNPLPRDQNQSVTSLEPFTTSKVGTPTWELDSTPSRSNSYQHQLREKLSMDELAQSLPTKSSFVAQDTPASTVNFQRTYTNQIDTMTPVVVIADSATTDDPSMKSRQQGERPGEIQILERCANSAPSLEEPFRLSFIKVYRNILSDDLRVVTTTADDTAKVTSTHHGSNILDEVLNQIIRR